MVNGDIKDSRWAILQHFQDTFGKPKVISAKQLQFLFDQYDGYVFNGDLKKKLQQADGKVHFSVKSVSPFMTAYTEELGGGEYRMVIHRDTLKNANYNNAYVGDLRCINQTECLMLIFEHELVHIIIHLYEPSQNYDLVGHGERFMTWLNEWFGHTTHQVTLVNNMIRKVGGDVELMKGDKVWVRKMNNKQIEMMGEIVEILDDDKETVYIVNVGDSKLSLPKENILFYYR